MAQQNCGDNGAKKVYIIVNIVLVVLYLVLWALCREKNYMFRALALSIIPSAVFLFGGVMTRHVLLLLAACLFAPAHILISCKNAK